VGGPLTSPLQLELGPGMPWNNCSGKETLVEGTFQRPDSVKYGVQTASGPLTHTPVVSRESPPDVTSANDRRGDPLQTRRGPQLTSDRVSTGHWALNRLLLVFPTSVA
jgi:hypothetical protein